MPSYSWGIPTEYCKTGMKLALIPGTICNKCYADKGFYKMPTVNAMYQKRYDAIEMNEWVDYMSELITQKYKKLTKSRLYHRWFDSGDIQSYSHLMKIFEVCENTPHIKHWIATREYSIVDKVMRKMYQKIYVCVYQLLKLMGLYLSSGSGHLVCINTKDTKVENVLRINRIMECGRLPCLLGS